MAKEERITRTDILNMRKEGVIDGRDWLIVKKERGKTRELLIKIILMKQENKKIKEEAYKRAVRELTHRRSILKELGERIETEEDGRVTIIQPEEELLIDQMRVPYDIILHKLPPELQMRIPLRIRTHLSDGLKIEGLSVTKPDGRALYLFHADHDHTCYGTMKTHLDETIESKEQHDKILQEYRDMLQTIKIHAGFQVGNDLVGIKNITEQIYSSREEAENVTRQRIIKARKGNPYLIMKKLEDEDENVLKTITDEKIIKKVLKAAQT